MIKITTALEIEEKRTAYKTELIIEAIEKALIRTEPTRITKIGEHGEIKIMQYKFIAELPDYIVPTDDILNDIQNEYREEWGDAVIEKDTLGRDWFIVVKLSYIEE